MVYIFLLLYNHMNILDNIPEIWQRRGVTNSLYDTILSWRMGYMGVLCTQYNFNFFFWTIYYLPPLHWNHFFLSGQCQRFFHFTLAILSYNRQRLSLQDVLIYHCWDG